MKQLTDNKYILGIDIGGTNIRAGLVDVDYQLSNFVIESSTQIMNPNHAAKKLILFIKRFIEEQAKDKKIAAISIGFPSTIDKNRKKILSTPNILGFNNINIVDELEEGLQIKTFINKDVNMLMLFDMYQGSVPDEGVTTGFYLGTGLGNAISINGHLLAGKNGAAAELGHIPSRGHNEACGCGNIGCVETFASGKYLRKLCDENFKDTHIGDVFKEQKDDPIIKNFIRELAIPIAAEINILDPDYIILGGGVLQMEGFPFEELEKGIHEFARKPYPEQNLHFLYSVPGQENGVIGAGIYALKEMKSIKILKVDR